MQVQTSEGPRCSADLKEISSSSDSIAVQVTSAGLSCNFSLFCILDSWSSPAHCKSDGETSSATICNITGLQPGTVYQLTAVSRKDGEISHGTVQTGRSAPEEWSCSSEVSTWVLCVAILTLPSHYLEQAPPLSHDTRVRVLPIMDKPPAIIDYWSYYVLERARFLNFKQ